MILITGATGPFGFHVITSLLQLGTDATEISALVRDKKKASLVLPPEIELKQGNYDDFESLKNAFRGADKLMFVSGNEIGKRDSQHKNVVDAAKDAGVKHIIYTSFIRKEISQPSGIAFLQDTHIKTENWIKESGLTYTILQNALYLDTVPMFLGENVLKEGTIYQPAAEGKMTPVLRSELAEAAARILSTEGHENKVYPLSNGDSVSYDDIAQILSEKSGKQIVYRSPSVSEFKEALQKKNVPAEYIDLFVGFSTAQYQGELELPDNTLESILGRRPSSVKKILDAIYA
ncbi:MAG: NAD(P)-dependent oxidoreductase [Pseudozobellia sp.]|nr:NAD(P)-dependent oxidoreductase [Pseudozobellia sp.]MBG48644.1 NAD(P)-dependent oxidoreductase [Pseudozobellia sp.]|tara:strand:- start:473 stop:1342 length:870 start_codon:yes stop_codon:yes gene_type:complete